MLEYLGFLCDQCAVDPERRKICGQQYKHKKSKKISPAHSAVEGSELTPKCSFLNPDENKNIKKL